LRTFGVWRAHDPGVRRFGGFAGAFRYTISGLLRFRKGIEELFEDLIYKLPQQVMIFGIAFPVLSEKGICFLLLPSFRYALPR